MKKIIPIIIVLFLLVSCGPNKEVKSIINSINNLGEITLESQEELETIESAYQILSDEDKEKVKNIDTFKEKQTAFNKLKEEKERKEKEARKIEEEIGTAKNYVAHLCLSYMKILKNPYSFKVRYVEAEPLVLKGVYNIIIEYTAKNSFGADVFGKIGGKAINATSLNAYRDFPEIIPTELDIDRDDVNGYILDIEEIQVILEENF